MKLQFFYLFFRKFNQNRSHSKYVLELASTLKKEPSLDEINGHEKSYKRSVDLENDDLYNYLDDMEDYQNLIKKARTRPYFC